ncbi:MAG: DUF1512 family protein [Candidatus Aenigmatarchaeota archaeon]
MEPLFLNMQIGGDWLGNIIWFIVLMIFFYFYPRILLYQALTQLEQKALLIESLMRSGKNIIIKKVAKTGRDVREAISNFLEFFVIEPVSLDPYGIIRKIEHLLNLSEKRFKLFVKQIAPNFNEEEQANLMMGLSGAISLNQVAKLVRHFVELIKKTKNLQLALVLQMQLPMIERISKALLKGTEALTNGWPIGDSIGPLIAAHLIGNSKTIEIAEDVVMARRKIKGRQTFVLKAKGPGGRLGKIGKAVENLVKRNKIAKIITIDAAAKLEGEKTGAIAEGVGAAIGGIGVDKSYIENIATAKNLPLDSIIIKMLPEEAIMPMRLEILRVVPQALKRVEDAVERTKEKGIIIIVGVGNSCGIGDSKKAALESEENIKKINALLKKRGDLKEMEKQQGSSYSLLGRLGGLDFIFQKIKF